MNKPTHVTCLTDDAPGIGRGEVCRVEEWTVHNQPRVTNACGDLVLLPDFAVCDGALRYDTGKNRVELVAPSLVEETARVLTFGAQKYDAHNWVRGMRYSRALGSLKRHLLAWEAGAEIDPESGLPHLSHVACNVMFLIEYARRVADGRLSAEIDDRMPQGDME